MRHKNVGTSFFRFVTIHAFHRQTDRQTDKQTDGFLVLYRALHYMHCSRTVKIDIKASLRSY